MKYEIWKLPVSNPNKFLSYSMINNLNLNDYVIVYSGKTADKVVSRRILEMLFERFNIDHPKDYYSESMSVSDVICTINEDTNERTWWYVDSFGFQKLKDNFLNGIKYVVTD